MDAFVIRTKKSSQKNENKSSLVKSRPYSTSSWLSSTSSQSSSSKSSCSDVGALNKLKPDWGQRKISDLDGVVILEKIQEYVQKLSDPNVASVAKIDILRRLQKKSPSTSIIKSSKIGKVVSKLADGSKSLTGTSHKDMLVQKQLVKHAKVLKQKWTEVIERRVELKEEGSKLDVKVDAISASFRNKAVSLMLEAMSSNCDNDDKNKTSTEDKSYEDTKSKLMVAIEFVEKYIFISNNKRTNNSYRKTVRKLTFDLKSNKRELATQISEKTSNEISYKSITKLIKTHLRFQSI